MHFGPWISTAQPDPFTGSELEPVWMVEFQSVMIDDTLQCEYPEIIECRAKNGKPNQKITCDVDVGLDCVGMEQDTNGASCYDYEVRIGCIDRNLPTCIGTTTVMPVTTTMAETTTLKPVVTTTTTSAPVVETCFEYSPWINTYTPVPGADDGEAINVLLLQSGFLTLEKIECRNTRTGKTFTESSKGIKCNIKAGFRCAASMQSSKRCDDFEIRVAKLKDTPECKPPETTIAVIPPTVPVEVTTQPPVDDCLDFSEWISTNTPSLRTDEIEDIVDVAEIAGIGKDDVLKVECRSKSSGVLSQFNGEKITCNVEEGLVCKFRRQDDSACDDYEIRVAKLKPLEICGYVPTTLASTTTQVTTTIQPCTTGKFTFSSISSCNHVDVGNAYYALGTTRMFPTIWLLKGVLR